MERDEFLELFCVEHGAPVPDDVVGAGRLLILRYDSMKDWERAMEVAKGVGLLLVKELSSGPGRSGRFELAFEFND